jgi:60 kDa SS-A/Ro ribonucleoprotein
MSDELWRELAKNMPWNTLRMNLNQLAKHNVFADEDVTRLLAKKLGDETEVLANNAFPYQLMTTYQHVDNVPMTIKMAIHQALEHATKNVPSLDSKIAVCIDQSGSMGSPVTGNRAGSTSKTMCTEVAALIAACVLRKNPETTVVGWDTSARVISNVNPADSVLTNARNMGFSGGGTDSACALKLLNQSGHKSNLVIYVSDNQGWYDSIPVYGYGTGMAIEWKKYKERNPKAKLVCINLQPYGTVQVPNDKDVLNIGGFSDAVFTIIKHFTATGNTRFVQVVNDYAGED